jgi:broad specificity phosphatase PhoE
MCSWLEIVFIRHAQGQHTLHPPASLDMIHPSLTPLGRKQAADLRNRLEPTTADLVVASPTIRTLQTASILTEHSGIEVFVSPWVGPRMFPLRMEQHTLLCDYIMSVKSVKKQFPGCTMVHNHYWGLSNEGINRMAPELFESVTDQLLSWAASRRAARILVISHDGTITHYRERLTGETLRREHFLGDAAYMALTVGQ